MTGCYNINTALTCRVISLASVYNSNSVKYVFVVIKKTSVGM